MNKTPSIINIARTDGISAFFTTLLLCVIVIFIYGGYSDGFYSDKLDFMYGCALFLLISIYARFLYLKPIFTNPIEHKGVITDIYANYTSGGSIFRYTYTIDDKAYKTFNIINSFGRSKVGKHKKGDEIVLLLTPDGKRSLIKDAYI